MRRYRPSNWCAFIDIFQIWNVSDYFFLSLFIMYINLNIQNYKEILNSYINKNAYRQGKSSWNFILFFHLTLKTFHFSPSYNMLNSSMRVCNLCIYLKKYREKMINIRCGRKLLSKLPACSSSSRSGDRLTGVCNR